KVLPRMTAPMLTEQEVAALELAKKNSRFTQVSTKGLERVRELLKDSQGISALKLNSFLA
ncbi:hypothetical protein O5853_29585, partial [Escherichia coli]|nr:hypothetical protein [Escherichia coli]